MNSSRFLLTVLVLVGMAPPMAAASPSRNPLWPADFAEPWPQLQDMVVVRADLGECARDAATDRPVHHDDVPIPRTIHQVWFGDPAIFDDERANSWQQVAADFGYGYHLWTEEDDAFVASQFGAETLDYIDEMRRQHRYDAASDILRYHLLEHFGGMYFDIDVPAPRRQGALLDPATLWPMRGLVLVSENDTREVNSSAFYAINAVMMSSPHHPVMSALVAGLSANRTEQTDPLRAWSAGAIFMTGQALVTASVRGTATFIPYGYMHALGMEFWPDVIPYREALRAKFLQRAVQPKRKAHVHLESPR